MSVRKRLRTRSAGLVFSGSEIFFPKIAETPRFESPDPRDRQLAHRSHVGWPKSICFSIQLSHPRALTLPCPRSSNRRHQPAPAAHRLTSGLISIRKWLAPSLRDELTFRGFASTQAGRKSKRNADRFRVQDDVAVYAVADGFGSELEARDAAEIVVREVVDHLGASLRREDMSTIGPLERMIEKRFSKAALAVNAFADLVESRCGASLAVVVCRENQALIASVGSCRVYLLRRGKLSQITNDDTMGAELRRTKAIPPDTKHHRLDKMLSKSLGDREPVCPQVHTHRIYDDDRLLLLTDGIHGSLSSSQIAEMSGSRPIDTVPVRLISAARSEGSRDDCAAVIVASKSRAKIDTIHCDRATPMPAYASVPCNGVKCR